MLASHPAKSTKKPKYTLARFSGKIPILGDFPMSNAMIDLSQIPSSIFAKAQDPASVWPGAPANFGEQVLPHIYTVSGQAGLAARAYLNADEALKYGGTVNSERMRVDCGIMECLGARQRATALLNWHIEAETESDEAKILKDAMTKILKRTPRFLEMRRNLLEAVWYGRYGVAKQFGSIDVCGRRQTGCVNWEPRHGDKLVFRYDDGTRMYQAGQVGIRIGMAGISAGRGVTKLNRDQISAADQGMIYWLSDWERKTVIVHKHEVEDGIFEDSLTSGRIHGVGARSRVYWTWYAMCECLQRALEYLDRSAFGVEIWRYPANNPRAEAQTKAAAKKQVSGGRSVVFVPVFPGEQQDLYGVEHIEPGLAGVDKLLDCVKTYFGHRIKRYILGQTLTSEAEATGMGSGVADAHLATFADIVQYDARNLEETLTTDFLRVLQLMNFPKSNHIQLNFVIDTDAPNIKEKMEALKAAWEMGLQIKDSDVADIVGVSLPTETDKRLFNPQVVGAILQMTQGGSGPLQPAMPAPPPSSPEQFAAAVISALQAQNHLSLAQ
jgi:hypothetical protein